MSAIQSLTLDVTATEIDEAALVEAAWANPRGGFIRLVGYVSSTSGEVADHLINGSVSWRECLVRSIEQVSKLTAEQVAASSPACGGDVALAQRALDEVLASWQKALDRIDQGEDSTSNYEYLAPGVATLPTENGDNAVYVWGLAVAKQVHQEGDHPVVKSKPLTLVKRAIEKGTPCSRFRRFKLTDSSSFTEVRMAGRTITPDQLRRVVAAGE